MNSGVCVYTLPQVVKYAVGTSTFWRSRLFFIEDIHVILYASPSPSKQYTRPALKSSDTQKHARTPIHTHPSHHLGQEARPHLVSWAVKTDKDGVVAGFRHAFVKKNSKRGERRLACMRNSSRFQSSNKPETTWKGKTEGVGATLPASSAIA